jgi:hypothetical protein
VIQCQQIEESRIRDPDNQKSAIRDSSSEASTFSINFNNKHYNYIQESKHHCRVVNRHRITEHQNVSLSIPSNLPTFSVHAKFVSLQRCISSRNLYLINQIQNDHRSPGLEKETNHC